jgi:conjugal transfer/type IV secretion protein DotA/TraY
MSGTLMPSQQSIDRDNRFVAKALLMATAQEYLIQREHMKLSNAWIWRGNENSGDWVYTQVLGKSTKGNANNLPKGVTPQKFIAGLGTIEVSCSNSMMNSTGAVKTMANSGVISSIKNSIFSGLNWIAGEVKSIGVPGAQVTYAQKNPVCMTERNAITTSLTKIYPIAQQIVNQNAQANAVAILPSQIATIVNGYKSEQAAAYNALNKDRQAALVAQTHTFATEASKLGWAASSFYYWTLNNINTSSQGYLKMLQPKVNLPNFGYIAKSTLGYVGPAMITANAVINRYLSSNSYVGSAEAVATVGMPAGGVLSSGSGVSWMGGPVIDVVSSLDSGNPLANMMGAGHDIIDAGGLIAAGPSLAAGALKVAAYGAGFAGGVAGTAVEPGGGSLVGAGLAYKATKLAGKAIVTASARAITGMPAANEIAIPVGLFMIVEGAIIAYVIPALPGVIMIFAIIGWLFMVMELLVAAPLLAAAHAYAEGEGFAPQQTSYGYAAAIGIVMRPVLLTFGFIIMFFMIFIVGHFVGSAMTVYMMGMNGFHIGVIGGVAVLAIIIGTIFGSIKIVMKLITHLADTLPQYLGARSSSVFNEGAEGERAATGGADKAKAVGLGAYGVGKSAAANAAKRREQNGAGGDQKGGGGGGSPKTESTTNPGTNAASLGQADTKGKGGGGGKDDATSGGSSNSGSSPSSGGEAGGSSNSGSSPSSGGEAGGSSNSGSSPSSGGEAGGKSQPGGQDGGASTSGSGNSSPSGGAGGKAPKTLIGTGYAHGQAVRNWIAGGGTPGKK